MLKRFLANITSRVIQCTCFDVFAKYVHFNDSKPFQFISDFYRILQNKIFHSELRLVLSAEIKITKYVENYFVDNFSILP